jgi:hypothetical protein
VIVYRLAPAPRSIVLVEPLPIVVTSLSTALTLDKYKGKLNVYVDAVEIVDSDVHINQTLYTVNCTAQSLDRPLPIVVTSLSTALTLDPSAFLLWTLSRDSPICKT